MSFCLFVVSSLFRNILDWLQKDTKLPIHCSIYTLYIDITYPRYQDSIIITEKKLWSLLCVFLHSDSVFTTHQQIKKDSKIVITHHAQTSNINKTGTHKHTRTLTHTPPILSSYYKSQNKTNTASIDYLQYSCIFFLSIHAHANASSIAFMLMHAHKSTLGSQGCPRSSSQHSWSRTCTPPAQGTVGWWQRGHQW